MWAIVIIVCVCTCCVLRNIIMLPCVCVYAACKFPNPGRAIAYKCMQWPLLTHYLIVAYCIIVYALEWNIDHFVFVVHSRYEKFIIFIDTRHKYPSGRSEEASSQIGLFDSMNCPHYGLWSEKVEQNFSKNPSFLVLIPTYSASYQKF